MKSQTFSCCLDLKSHLRVLRGIAISPLSHSGALTAFAKSFFWCRPKGVEGSEELKAVANHWHNLLPSKKHQKSLPILTNWHKSSCKPSAAKLASIKKYQKPSQIFPKLEWTIGIQGFAHWRLGQMNWQTKQTFWNQPSSLQLDVQQPVTPCWERWRSCKVVWGID